MRSPPHRFKTRKEGNSQGKMGGKRTRDHKDIFLDPPRYSLIKQSAIGEKRRRDIWFFSPFSRIGKRRISKKPSPARKVLETIKIHLDLFLRRRCRRRRNCTFIFFQILFFSLADGGGARRTKKETRPLSHAYIHTAISRKDFKFKNCGVIDTDLGVHICATWGWCPTPNPLLS